MPRLVIDDGSGFAVALEIASAVRIGRGSECELTLADAKVSRVHARVEPDGDRWRVFDEGSLHGTYVNGARVEGAAPLVDGDRVQVGETVVMFHAAGSPSRILASRTRSETGEPRPGRLEIFYNLATAARSIDELDAVLARALEGVTAAVGADRGLIALARARRAPRRIAEVGGDGVVIARAVLDAVGRDEAVLIRARDGDDRRTLQAQNIGSAIAAPLGDGLGFLYVDRLAGDDRRPLDEADLDFVAALATTAGAFAAAATRFDRATAAAEAAAAPAPVILGSSPPILAVRRDIERLGAAEIAVHISGESGVGKELVARALHAASARAGAALVPVNCAALPDTLIESELFGHARGAFTGATQSRRGKFILADGGTLFLDEVADLSLAAQAKILRVLEDGVVAPIGADRSRQVDVRVITASHKSLREEVAAGRFREDLYYRLVVAELAVPPLRDRGDDIAALAGAFLETARERGARASRFGDDALAALAGHRWPGNVRELRNVVERAAALAAGDTIEVADLRLDPPRPGVAATTGSLAERFAALDVIERELVESAMREADGNVSAAARLLGISRVMMKRRVERFALKDPR